MERLLAKKRVLKSRVTRFQSTVSNDMTKQEKEEFLMKVKDVEEQLNELLVELSIQSNEEEYSNFEIEFNMLDERLNKIRREVNFCDQTSNEGSGLHTGAAELKLPKFELPTFRGHYDQWISFHDLFVASVHNNSKLSGGQKLQYLKSSMKGEAAALIKSFPITDANYNQAWQTLLDRYQNIREIVNANLDKLLNQSAISGSSSSALRNLVDTTNECVRSIQVLGVATDTWDAILVHIVSRVLDATSRRDWELSLAKTEMPSFEKLIKFLDHRANALMVAGSKGVSSTKRAISVHQGTSVVKCPLCEDNHNLDICQEFRKLQNSEQQRVLKKQGLCFNCLKKGHRSKFCKSGHCKHCQKHHHTLLHSDEGKSEAVKGTLSLMSQHIPTTGKEVHILLATAIVNVIDDNGLKYRCRALVDSASQATFVTESCLTLMKVKRTHSDLSVVGIGGRTISQPKGKVRLTIQSVYDPSEEIQVVALIMPRITTNQPMISLNKEGWNHLTGLQLADPEFMEPRPVDMLLGADVYAQLVTGGVCKGNAKQPIGIQTRFGWIILGLSQGLGSSNINSYLTQMKWDKNIERFWDVEMTGSAGILTEEEEMCENHFNETHKRDSQGKFVVQLPLRKNVPQLGSSYEMACNRWKQMEKRLSRNSSLHMQYNQFMEEYLQLGHMEQVTAIGDERIEDKPIYYIPHHAVVNLSSTTTKLRVVFDASAQSMTGTSLNDMLIVRPKVQGDILPLIIKFCLHLIAMSADIEKMYPQIWVDEKHWDLLLL